MSDTRSSQAVTLATRSSEIGFPEFTSKLVMDVFDAMISANLKQIAAYSELFTEISKGLTTFINDTKDDVGSVEIFEFLAKVLPDETNGTKVLANKDSPTPLGADAEKLNEALAIRDADGKEIENLTLQTSDTYRGKFTEILTATAKRIAANKYETLEKMLRMGFMRLVVESGKIETKLNFSTWGSDYNTALTSQCTTTTTRKSSALPCFFRWFLPQTNTQTVKVETASTSSSSTLGSRTDLFGQVVINFKTDYMPLGKE